MEKAGGKRRDIKFFSQKCNAVICVHSQVAREYARMLEQQSWVESYEVSVPFETSKYGLVDPVEIRPLYFQTEWASDFLLRFVDKRQAVREIVPSIEALQKLATIEKLEFSRRYWKAMGVSDWKIILPREEQGSDND